MNKNKSTSNKNKNMESTNKNEKKNKENKKETARVNKGNNTISLTPLAMKRKKE